MKKEPGYITPTIDSNIPLPASKTRKPRAKTVGKRISWPFFDMAVGDSFLVPEHAEPTRVQAAISKARTEGRMMDSTTFQIHKTDAGFRVWRIS